MNTLPIAEKRQIILEHERQMAQRLAKLVIDKPKPPLWMILIPIFFVFFAQKMKQYTKSSEDFVTSYLKARTFALDAAIEAGEDPVDARVLGDKAGNIPKDALPFFVAWMEILTDHYTQLLASPGTSFTGMIRAAYRSKTDFLLFCNALNKTEQAYNEALLPGLQEDRQDLLDVIGRMHEAVTVLRRNDADEIFP